MVEVINPSVINDFNSLDRFVAFASRPNAEKECIVSKEMFDLITQGDTASHFCWYKNVKCIEEGFKEHVDKAERHTVAMATDDKSEPKPELL